MTHFAFLRREWPEVFEAAGKAEVAVHSDPRTACFYARRTLELAVAWTYKHDPALRLPYQDNLSALIHDPTFKQAAGEAVFNKARVINTLGVDGHRYPRDSDAARAVWRAAAAVPQKTAKSPTSRTSGRITGRSGLKYVAEAGGTATADTEHRAERKRGVPPRDRGRAILRASAACGNSR